MRIQRKGGEMSAAEFVIQYGQALATQQWEAVDPLVHQNASVTFSDGSVHKGKEAVRAAYERNFQAIADEKYQISNVHWLLDTSDTAAYLFDFHWSGKINGKVVSGAGRGTSVLIQNEGRWYLLAEHLGPNPRVAE
jgi:ketosteroid isomerase-like protein